MNRGAFAGRLRRTYLQIDLRSLALGRIVLGLVLIGDLLRRVPYLRDLYSNLGLIPNHTVLWRPPFPRIFSVFFMASLPEEAALWFFVAFVCFFCFLVGYRTRLFHLLSFAMTTSLHNRVLAAENWGGVAIGVLMVWTAFLPLGRRFSVDALRASLRARPDETPSDLAAGVPPPDERQTTSLAALGLLLQIAAIYWLNFVHKSGPTWRDGSAVHYVLWQERIVTWIGLQVRENAPYAFTKLLTWGTLVIEAVGGVPGADADLLALDALRGGAPAGRLARRHRAARQPGDLLVRDDGLPAVPAHRRAVDAVLAAGPAARPRADGLLRRRLRHLLGGGARAGADGRPSSPALGPQQRARRAAGRGRSRAARSDDAGLRSGDRSALDARRGLRGDLRRPAARAALGLADAAARGPHAGRPRLRPLRAQPDDCLRLVRPGRLRSGAGRRRRRVATAAADSGDAAAGLVSRADAVSPGARRRRRVRGARRRGLGGQPGRPARAAVRASPRVDGGGGHVPAHLRGVVPVLARRAPHRRERSTSMR